MKERISTIILLFALIPFSRVGAQTDYSVPLTFTVTQTGVNRFIASQFNSPSQPFS